MRRPWLLPLVPLYWVGLRVKDGLTGQRGPAVGRLDWPVISVGSLSAGGAGKTPVVLMLADLLGQHGVEVDVLSRGYGRRSGLTEEVDVTGSAARFGDEPLMIAGTGIKVFVSPDRWAAGKLAEERKRQDRRADEVSERRIVHLVDDGFQHRGLVRDLDVVLLTLEDGEDCLLPSGNLREPYSALRRANVVVVREEEEAEELAGVIRRWTEADVWVVRRELVLPEEVPQRPVVFCGIARPDGFFGMLQEAGVEAAGVVLKPDHHAYSAEDVEMLVESAKKVEADGFVTTAKDAVKISAEWRARLEEVGPVVVAGLRVRLVDEAKALATLRRVCGF